MSITSVRSSALAEQRLTSLFLAVTVILAWTGLLAYGASVSLWKPVGFSIVAACALIAGSLLVIGPRQTGMVRMVDGAASGAMLAGILIFVVPDALRGHAWLGAAGLAMGVLIGVGITALPDPDRHDPAVIALTLHALCAGFVIGALYARMPALGIAAGTGIIAHKMPAGYLLARQLKTRQTRVRDITLPALATGLGALPVAIWRLDSVLPAGLLLGIAGGLFAYVGLMFGRRLQNVTPYTGVEIGAAIAGGTVVALIALLGVLTG